MAKGFEELYNEIKEFINGKYFNIFCVEGDEENQIKLEGILCDTGYNDDNIHNEGVYEDLYFATKDLESKFNLKVVEEDDYGVSTVAIIFSL